MTNMSMFSTAYQNSYLLITGFVLSIEAKLLYGMMIDRMELSQKNGWIDAQGRVYIFLQLMM